MQHIQKLAIVVTKLGQANIVIQFQLNEELSNFIKQAVIVKQTIKNLTSPLLL